MFDSLLEKLDFYNENKNRLSNEILYKINKSFDIDFTYNSTTIEGNTLTLLETKVVLEDNISIGGKELREIYEVTNHNSAFDYVKKSIQNNEELDEDKVKDIHEILTKNIFQGGIYRSTDVYITGATHTPPTPNDMYNQLRFFYNDLKENDQKMNPIELAAWTHAEFVRIHPFSYENGRTSRLIMNYQLMKKGFLPISIKVEDRLNYYDALDIYATKKDIVPFVRLIADLEKKRLDEINHIINQQIEAENLSSEI